MRKAVRMAAVVAVLAIVAAACSNNGGSSDSSSTPSDSGAALQQGGTLNLAQTSDVSAAFDPQKEYYQLSFEYFKCCILRALLSTKAVPSEDGGSELQPDLASALPTVSDDGLTYTFTLKPGIKYAPPLQDVEVTATVESGDVSVALAGQCGFAATEIACAPSYFAANGGSIARFRARSLGSTTDDTTLPLYVETDVRLM